MNKIFLSCVLSLIAVKAGATEEKRSFHFQSETSVLIDELVKASGQRGVDLTVISFNNVKATLKNAVANSNRTGFNRIDTGAFTDAGGIISVIRNTGNNVIIQDATIANVTIQP